MALLVVRAVRPLSGTTARAEVYGCGQRRRTGLLQQLRVAGVLSQVSVSVLNMLSTLESKVSREQDK